MSYYDLQPWQSPPRHSAWEQAAAPPRSGTSSSAISHDESSAFGPQLEEVERALDNLAKSGKLFSMPSRRDPGMMPAAPRPFADFDPRMGAAASRHQSLDFDPMRSHSASNLQSFYATQRFQPRHTEADQMQQAKRRMAAQRERELRNYHQEQQYNRTVVGSTDAQPHGKSDRSISPGNMNDDDRRELIARQHRALYANEAAYYDADARGPSPHAYSSFADQQALGSDDSGAKRPSPKPDGQPTSPSSANPQQQQQQQHHPFQSNPAQQKQTQQQQQQQPMTRTSTSSPGGASPSINTSLNSASGNASASSQGAASSASAIAPPAPIGTRAPTKQNSITNSTAMASMTSKRATPPLNSTANYVFADTTAAPSLTTTVSGGERSASAASGGPAASTTTTSMTTTPATSAPSPSTTAAPGSNTASSGMGWPSSSTAGAAVWGKTPLGVQASVWG